MNKNQAEKTCWFWQGDGLERRTSFLAETECCQTSVSEANSMMSIDLEFLNPKAIAHSQFMLSNAYEGFEFFADFSRATLWEVDLVLRQAVVGRHLKSMLGYHEHEEIPQLRDWSLLLHESEQELVRQKFESFLTLPIFEAEFEHRLRRKDGSFLWVLTRLQIERDHQQNPIRILALTLDVAKLKDREEILQRSNKDLEEFAAVISHDLKQPLCTIMNNLKLIEKTSVAGIKKENNYVRAAEAAAARLADMVENVLSYSKVSGEQIAFDWVDVDSLIINACANLRTQIEDSRAEFIVDELPRIYGNGIQLTQVFQNLIGNAIKFRSSKPLRIRIKSRLEKGRIIIEIQDNGIGFDQERAEDIFETFKRLDGEQSHEGLGLGLAISKRIVERHRGKIWAESQKGEGSRFYISLPENPL